MGIILRGKTWYVYWREGANVVQRTTGSENREVALQVDQELAARRKAERVRRRVAALLGGGEMTVEPVAKVEPDSPRDGIAPADLWQRYELAPHPRETLGRTEQTKRNTVAAFVKWLGVRFPTVRDLRQVTEQVAAQYVEELTREGISGQTRNNRRSMLRRVWSVIRVQAGITSNPWDAVLRVEARHQPKRALTAEEVKKLYNCACAARAGTDVPVGCGSGRPTGVGANGASGHGDADEAVSVRVPGFWPAAVGLGWHTGLRLGDVCELDWSELAGNELRLIPNKGWRKGARLIFPVHEDWAKWLPKRAKESGPVWPGMAAAYRTQQRWMFDEFTRICKAAGIETRKDGRTIVGFHSLRSGLVTAALAAGAKATDVQQAIGHETAGMTEHYNQGKERQARQAGRRIARRLPALG